MTIRRAITPAPRRDWNELLREDTDAVLEQTPLWIDAVSTAGRFRDASVLYQFSDGRRFVLPMVRRPAMRQRTGFAPGWGIGGLVGPDLDAEAVTHIVADLARGRELFTHVRPNPLQAEAWRTAETGKAVAVERRAHVVDLRGGMDATRGRLRKSGERGLRLADRAGVEVTVHTGGEKLEAYYRQLYLPAIARWAERQNEPLALARARAARRDPFSKLLSLARTLQDKFRLYLGWVDGVPASGNIVLSGPNSHATRGALRYGLATKSRAGYATDWAAIADACQAGHRWYQMGESGDNQSLADYKQRFGAAPIEYREYRMERLPLLAVDTAVRNVAKRMIGFRDT